MSKAASAAAAQNGEVPGQGSFAQRLVPKFSDHSGRPGARIWRRPALGAIVSTCVAILCALLALGMSGLAVFMLLSPDMGGVGALIMALIASFIFALTHYLWRDAAGKRGGTIVLTDEGIELDLIQGRSLTHRSPACRVILPWRAIRSLDFRLEGYGAQGLAMMQRSYWLVPHAGSPILLFEDRAIASRVATIPMTRVAREIAERGGVPMIERGMVKGRGGVLGAWFAQAPDLDAETLSPAEQARLWRRVWLTAIISASPTYLVLLAMILR